MQPVQVIPVSPSAASAPSATSAASAPAAVSPAAASTAAASMPAAASSPAAASAPIPASTPVVEIDVYGDDAMSGIAISNYGLMSLTSPDEPQALQSLLQAQFNDTGVTVASYATGGTSSSLANMLAGVDGGGGPFAQRVTQHPGVIVIDNHAINDMYGGETLQDYATDLAAYINAVRAAGKTPVLEEPGPVCDGNHPQLADYVDAMDSVAASYNVPLIRQYAYVQGVAGWQSHMLQCFYPDAYLDGLKAHQEQAVIGPLVAKLIGT